MYYRGANAALVVYDITKLETFHSVRGWVEGLSVHSPSPTRRVNCLTEY